MSASGIATFLGSGLTDPEAWEDPGLVGNLKPISLLPHVSKIFEHILKRQLCDHLRDRDILILEQFGFRERHF